MGGDSPEPQTEVQGPWPSRGSATLKNLAKSREACFVELGPPNLAFYGREC